MWRWCGSPRQQWWRNIQRPRLLGRGGDACGGRGFLAEAMMHVEAAASWQRRGGDACGGRGFLAEAMMHVEAAASWQRR
eukprot:364501-Chlamydomonas_euryale.AAC.6